MTNTYRAISDRARAIHGEDDLELDLSAADERDALTGGHLEIVPRRYLVLVDNFADAGQGETYEAAYPADREAALVSGGVLERIQDVPPADDALDNDPDVDDTPPGTTPVDTVPAKQKED